MKQVLTYALQTREHTYSEDWIPYHSIFCCCYMLSQGRHS